jgi:hypothetical protein
MSDYQRWLEGEIDDSDLARLQARKVNHILDGIKTEAGKRLWTKINDNYGSSVWGPVGDGIVEIEAEVEARIIKLLETKMACENDANCAVKHPYGAWCSLLQELKPLIKGEK